MKLVSRRQNDKNTETFWMSRCVTSKGRLTFSARFSLFHFKKRSSRRKSNNNNNNRLERLFIFRLLFNFVFRINYFNQSSIIIITSINEIFRSFLSTANNVFKKFCVLWPPEWISWNRKPVNGKKITTSTLHYPGLLFINPRFWIRWHTSNFRNIS